VKRTTWVNGVAFLGSLAIAAALAPGQSRRPVVEATALFNPASPVRKVALPGGGTAVLDSLGYPVPLRPYQRIVSTSIVTDRLLLELCEPDRILAFSAAGARESLHAFQYAGKPAVEGLGALEGLISLKPDLLLMSRFGDAGRVSKLRAAGIEVFDLGELHGVASLGPIAAWVGELVGHPDRAAMLMKTFQRRMAGVAASLGGRKRRTAIYVAAIGPALIGGTEGTSYHDVLVAAGLIDAAAGRYKNWPQYSAEQLMALDPELLVTKTGMGNALCAYPGLEHLRACTPGRVIELPPGMIEDPGLTMLETAELLFERAYAAP
jgi:iron complex transport system substrate-binding protein